jgi:hypothetical protein
MISGRHPHDMPRRAMRLYVGKNRATAQAEVERVQL